MPCEPFKIRRCRSCSQTTMDQGPACPTCGSTDLAVEGGGFVCSRGRQRRQACAACGSNATLLCDWKLTGEKAGKTCDAPMCRRCARLVGPDKHLCPPHARLWDQHPRNPARRAG